MGRTGWPRTKQQHTPQGTPHNTIRRAAVIMKSSWGGGGKAMGGSGGGGGGGGGGRGGRVFSVPERRTSGARILPTKPDQSIGTDIKIKRTRTFANGLKLTIGLGDITCENVDVIVNAANSRLSHGAGLARAIVKKGGASIRRESDEWLRQHGPIPTGELAVTRAGNMQAQYCFHVVGPIWEEGDGQEIALLRASIDTALIKADLLQCKSISIPAISSGLFRFPKDKCAEILIQAAQDFDTSPNWTGHLQEVRYVNFDSDTVGYFERHVDRHIPVAAPTPTPAPAQAPQEEEAASPTTLAREASEGILPPREREETEE